MQPRRRKKPMGRPPRAVETGLEKADYELLAAFRRELRQFLAFSERVAQAAGLPAQQYQALLAIKGYPGREQVTVGELARDLLIEQPTASELADRLVTRGMLTRRNDDLDRRRTFLVLTAEAQAILDRLARTHLEELRRIRPSLTDLLGRFSGDAPERSVSGNSGTEGG